MRLLTSGGHQADDDGGGGGWALDQHSHQDPHHQSRHGVGQHCVVPENVPCHFTWLNMPPTHTHTHTHYWSQTWQLPRAMLNKAHGACSPKSKKVSGWNYALNYTALAPVGRSELVCGDSLICQTSTGWVTTSTPRGQRGWRYLPPANWKAELRVSREQTKKKRRMKRRGILDVFTRSCCILFGLCGELSAQKQQQQPGRRLASQCALNLE